MYCWWCNEADVAHLLDYSSFLIFHVGFPYDSVFLFLSCSGCLFSLAVLPVTVVYPSFPRVVSLLFPFFVSCLLFSLFIPVRFIVDDYDSRLVGDVACDLGICATSRVCVSLVSRRKYSVRNLDVQGGYQIE